MITQVKPNMLVAREETFGPVAPVFSFKDEKEAIRMANDTEFGLASYFYTRDLARSLRVAEALEYGIVGLNTGLISTEVAPFGGDQGVGHRSRGLQVRHPGLHRAQVSVHRWHRGLSDRALLLLLAAIITLGSIATNMYIPALPAVREYFDAGVAEVQATFAVALVTFAVGILVWGPGLRPLRTAPGDIRRASPWLRSARTIGLTAQSLGWLVVGRAVQAFGTSVGIAVSRAIVSDRYPPDRMARMLAQLGVVSVTANALAPVVGGYLASGFGWRSIFGGAARRRRHRRDRSSGVISPKHVRPHGRRRARAEMVAGRRRPAARTACS